MLLSLLILIPEQATADSRDGEVGSAADHDSARLDMPWTSGGCESRSMGVPGAAEAHPPREHPGRGAPADAASPERARGAGHGCSPDNGAPDLFMRLQRSL